MEDDKPDLQEIIKQRKRLNIPQTDLDAEAEQIAEMTKMVNTEGYEKKLARIQKALDRPVEVSVSPKGKIRRNGSCPCGSKLKFKHCCLDKVRNGTLDPVRGPKK